MNAVHRSPVEGVGTPGDLARLSFGAAKRDEVIAKVEAAMALVEAEIAAEREKCGKDHYPRNKGRFSLAEFCKRANVDKNTLRYREYHRPLRDKVDRFVQDVQVRLGTATRELRRAGRRPPEAVGMRATLQALAEENALLRRKLKASDDRVRQLEAACRHPGNRRQAATP